jgi:predicted transcriptional regulator
MTVIFSLDLNQNEASKVSVTFASSVFTILSEQKRYWPHVTQVVCTVRINEKHDYFTISTFFNFDGLH